MNRTDKDKKKPGSDSNVTKLPPSPIPGTRVAIDELEAIPPLVKRGKDEREI